MKIALGKKISLFWVLQLIGWGTFGIIRNVLHFFAFDNSFGMRKVVFTGFGFLMSVGLYLLYRRLWQRRWSFFALAGATLLASPLAALIWLTFCELAIMRLGIDGFLGRIQSDWPMLAAFWMNLTTVMLAWSALYFGIKYWRDLQEQREQTLAASASAHEAHLRMLRYQLNPHFLFNALNSIRALIYDSNQNAKQMVTALSDFLRYTLTSDEAGMVSLQEELKAIRSYLEIEKIRFGDKLSIDYEISPEAERCSVPGFLLHPLVENAVKYGMQTSPMPLHIRIRATADNSRLRVEVVNSGHLFGKLSGKEESTGTGLANVRARLEQFSESSNDLRVVQENGCVKSILEMESRDVSES